MSVDREQISLGNALIRFALKQGDSMAISRTTLQLCKGDREKADLLSLWFVDVGKSCKEYLGTMTENQVFMRMWMLGNVDIKQVSESGNPIFILTKKGVERVRHSPKEKWRHKLLWDNHEVSRDEECVIS
ncbi:MULTISPECIES: hypothetical protein [unclassified Prochlorococcus]|nr:hypothetical protein [Prochlorococcus sp. MIT 0702]KGG29347.1 hypothetical protein EV12_0204 [Prochlorococcus sp. MIT 0701]